MKAFLLIISLALCQIALAQRGSFTVVDPNTVNNDQEIQSALTFGAHFILEQGVETFILENVNYDVTKIFNVWKQVVHRGINYAFDVEISGDDGSVFRARYIVNVNGRNNKKQVLFWVAKSENGEVNEGEVGEAGEAGEAEEFNFLPEEVFEEEAQLEEFVPVDPIEVLFDFDLRNALDFGVLQVTRRGIQDGQLRRQRYRLDKINSIERQVTANGLNYKFDVNLKGRRGATARVVFEVHMQIFTGFLKLTSFKFLSVK